MVEEGFERRGWQLDDIQFATAEHKVDRLGCAMQPLLLEGEPVGGSPEQQGR